MKKVQVLRTGLALVLLLLGCFASAAADTGLVVRSPFYGEGTENGREALPLEVSSFPAQLGLPDAPPAEGGNAEEKAMAHLLSALGDAAYPLTPGDVYRLSYMDGQRQVVLDLVLDATYAVTVPNIGTLDCRGLTFLEFKERLGAMIDAVRSFANTQVVLTRTGSFRVPVIGEVASSREVEGWGLARLSSAAFLATPYASSRSVTVRHADGTEDAYDLYRGVREGDRSQNPLLRPGDVVVFRKADRIVTLSGMVQRPGTYQIEGDSLSVLLSRFGGGVLPGADVGHVRIQRFDAGSASWRTLAADLNAKDFVSLQSMDRVMVDGVPMTDTSVTVEGAVRMSEAVDSTSSTALLGMSSGRIFYQFYPGETLGQMLRTLSGRMLTVSDLGHAYLVRDGRRTDIDLQPILLGLASGDDVVLQAGDSLTIPFTQRFVTVEGAVTRSGVYAYVPDKPASYYVAVAGGPTTDARKPYKVSIKDKFGNKLDEDDLVPPEATINIKTNTFVKDLAPTVAVVGLVASTVAIVLSCIQMRYYWNRDN